LTKIDTFEYKNRKRKDFLQKLEIKWYTKIDIIKTPDFRLEYKEEFCRKKQYFKV
jgi:hypothetical protein